MQDRLEEVAQFETQEFSLNKDYSQVEAWHPPQCVQFDEYLTRVLSTAPVQQQSKITNIADFLSTQILSVSSAAATTVGKTLTDYKKKVDEDHRMKEIEIQF